MPARVFNAVRASLEGRMSAASESQKLHHQTLEGLIDRTEKQAAYSACIRRHSESGRGTVVLTTSGPKATSADTMSIHTLDNQDRLRPSATAVSRPRSSRPISTGRSHSCESDTLTQRSSATSAPGSTSGAKGYLPYWNDYTREISSVLWSPTETVLQGLGPNSSRPCSNAMAGSSWFSISETSAPKKNSRLTFSPSSLSSALASADYGATVRKSRKIRLYPDAGQRAEAAPLVRRCQVRL